MIGTIIVIWVLIGLISHVVWEHMIFRAKTVNLWFLVFDVLTGPFGVLFVLFTKIKDKDNE